MNSMSFMKALGDIPEELVRCYFDENIEGENTAVSSDQERTDVPAFPHFSKQITADAIQPITQNSSEPTPDSPTQPIRFLLPVSFVAVAACLAFAVGWAVLIGRMKPNPITPSNDSDEMISTQDESSLALITDNPDSQSLGFDSPLPRPLHPALDQSHPMNTLIRLRRVFTRYSPIPTLN